MKATIEVVFLPSAVRPGTTFKAVTSEAIRQRNGQRWLVLQDRYRQRKARTAEATVTEFREAFAVALAGSLAHRSYGKGAM